MVGIVKITVIGRRATPSFTSPSRLNMIDVVIIEHKVIIQLIENRENASAYVRGERSMTGYIV